MQTVYLVSGNPNKVRELQPFFPEWQIERVSLDLDEIQSLDLRQICAFKSSQAFRDLQGPVLVEDTEFGLEALNGLPGPFIKFFEQKLGPAALIHLLKGHSCRRGTARTCLAYRKGDDLWFGMGQLHGEVTLEPVDGAGFGFDCCFIPDGQSVTLAEMGLKQKMDISHRRKAINDLRQKMALEG